MSEQNQKRGRGRPRKNPGEAKTSSPKPKPQPKGKLPARLKAEPPPKLNVKVSLEQVQAFEARTNALMQEGWEDLATLVRHQAKPGQLEQVEKVLALYANARDVRDQIMEMIWTLRAGRGAA